MLINFYLCKNNKINKIEKLEKIYDCFLIVYFVSSHISASIYSAEIKIGFR